MDGQNPTYNDISPDEPKGFVDRVIEFIELNMSRIIIGAIILVILIAVISGILFLVNRTRTNRNNAPTPTPTQTESQIQNVTGTQSASAQQTKNYTDSYFKYSVQIPSDWEAFRRTGNDTAYQTGFRKIGTVDSPIVINTQPSLGLGLDDYIVTMYGNGIQTESAKIGNYDGVKATIPTSNTVSYFVTKNGNIYELSSINDTQILEVFNKILSSFKFQ